MLIRHKENILWEWNDFDNTLTETRQVSSAAPLARWVSKSYLFLLGSQAAHLAGCPAESQAQGWWVQQVPRAPLYCTEVA